MLRALVLEYQDDPVTFTLGDQYLFGRHILVAPIFDETNRRRVYLPAGTWIDYWNKEKLEGGRWIEVKAPLDVLPLYVQGGAILPYGPKVHYVDEVARDPLTLEIYAPADQASYTIHDEGRPDIVVSYRCDDDRMKVNVGEAPGQVQFVLFGVNVEEAKVDGQRVASERLENGGVRISFDGRQPRTLEFELR
jgi:alpha-glucosidase (family GH31 glycosyl hydrolase)